MLVEVVVLTDTGGGTGEELMVEVEVPRVKDE